MKCDNVGLVTRHTGGSLSQVALLELTFFLMINPANLTACTFSWFFRWITSIMHCMCVCVCARVQAFIAALRLQGQFNWAWFLLHQLHASRVCCSCYWKNLEPPAGRKKRWIRRGVLQKVYVFVQDTYILTSQFAIVIYIVIHIAIYIVIHVVIHVVLHIVIRVDCRQFYDDGNTESVRRYVRRRKHH